MQPEPQKEHQWLEKLIGEWTYESEAIMGPDQPPFKATGTESVRSLGGRWVLCEGESAMPDGSPMKSIITLGYDPDKKKYVGTYVGSMMNKLWIYEGELDETGNVLPLESEGPSFSRSGELATYRDTIEFKSDDERTFSSSVLQNDGTWQHFMTMTYRRKS